MKLRKVSKTSPSMGLLRLDSAATVQELREGVRPLSSIARSNRRTPNGSVSGIRYSLP